MEHCNGLTTPTKVEAPLGTDEKVTEYKINGPNSYASVIGIMLYLSSNTGPDILFAVHNCYWFTHNIEESHDTDIKKT